MAHENTERKNEVRILTPQMMSTVNIHGYGDKVEVLSKSVCCCINIYGCDNTVVIEEGVASARMSIDIGVPDCPCFGGEVRIDKLTTVSGSAQLRLVEPNSSIHIGQDCLISSVVIWNTDTHTLYDERGRLNVGRELRIGDHVWIGQNVHIGKNVHIPDHCVIGMGSVVTGQFDEPHCVIAGVPARVCKRGVMWARERANEHMPEYHEQLEAYPDWEKTIEYHPAPPSAMWACALIWRWRFESCLHMLNRRRRRSYLNRIRTLKHALRTR